LVSHEFATTRWSRVLRAGHGSASASHEALAALCTTYWYPLYAYARRRGHGVDDALDLTQGFLATLLAGKSLRNVDPQRGRFRAFLLGAFEHYAAKQRRFWNALKRGGGRKALALDAGDAEQRYQLEPIDTRTPQKIYEASWARILIARAFDRVRVEYAGGGKVELFDRLRAHLTDEASDESYRALAAEFEMTEGALKVAVHRLRKRFRAALEAEIGDTLDDPGHVQDEIHHLFEALGG
jgi:RNA polymerase sigma-70 factor (ECF subfamily)